MSQPAIEFDQVSKKFLAPEARPKRDLKTSLIRNIFRFDKTKEVYVPVLDRVSFKIMSGEFIGIMGRNGVGKSTILKLMSGIYSPNSGHIRVNGVVAPLLELGAGFEMELSGLENIYLNAAILGYSRTETNSKIDAIIEFSELEEKIHHEVRTYSSGMLMRLGFSVAAHLNAPIILLDEVLGVGDAGFFEKCVRKIRSLHRDERRTIVLVSHDTNTVARECDRCILLENRRVVFDGPASEVTEKYLQTVRPEVGG